MSQFIAVPPERLASEVLQALLEEYASRDGTDYGQREFSLEEKVGQLHGQLRAGELRLLYDLDSEEWDLVAAEDAAALLGN